MAAESRTPAASPSTKTPQANVRLDTPDPAGRGTPKASPKAAGANAKLPHERDESVGMTGGARSEDMQQAHRDVARGLQDTDRGVPADHAYQKLKR